MPVQLEPITKDHVSINHLKIAIDAVPKRPEPLIPGQNSRRWLDDWSHYYQHATIAWQTAFEWHVGLIQRHAGISEELAHLTEWIAIDREEEEGMALIREKLQS